MRINKIIHVIEEMKSGNRAVNPYELGRECSSNASRILTNILKAFGLRRNYYTEQGHKHLQRYNRYIIAQINPTSYSEIQKKVSKIFENYYDLIDIPEAIIIRKYLKIENYWDKNRGSPLVTFWDDFTKNKRGNPSKIVMEGEQIELMERIKELDSLSDEALKGPLAEKLETRLAEINSDPKKGAGVRNREAQAELGHLIEAVKLDRALEDSPILATATPLIEATSVEVPTLEAIEMRRSLIEIDKLTPGHPDWYKSEMASLIRELGGVVAPPESLNLLKDTLKNGHLNDSIAALMKANQLLKSPDKSASDRLRQLAILSVEPGLNFRLSDSAHPDAIEAFLAEKLAVDSLVLGQRLGAFPIVKAILNDIVARHSVHEPEPYYMRILALLDSNTTLASLPLDKQTTLKETLGNMIKLEFDKRLLLSGPSQVSEEFELLAGIIHSAQDPHVNRFLIHLDDQLRNYPPVVRESILSSCKWEELNNPAGHSLLNNRLRALESLRRGFGDELLQEYVTELNAARVGKRALGEDLGLDGRELQFRQFLKGQSLSFQDAVKERYKTSGIEDKLKFMSFPLPNNWIGCLNLTILAESLLG